MYTYIYIPIYIYAFNISQDFSIFLTHGIPSASWKKIGRPKRQVSFRLSMAGSRRAMPKSPRELSEGMAASALT